MRELSRQYYLHRFLEYGEDVRSLWGSRGSQEVRFSVLCRVGDLSGASVLDVGCGFGDFYAYLKDHKIYPREYLGLDCVEETLAVAGKRHPDGRFENQDVLQLEMPNGFDWAVGSGLFTLTGPEWHEYVIRMVERMFSLARRGVAVNFLSSFANRRDGISHYAEPADILRLLSSGVSPATELIHSYRSNDFTVFLYKEFHKPGNP